MPQTRKTLVAAVVAAAATLMLGASGSHVPEDPYLRPAVAPAPHDNKITPERVELGKALFFDPRLSGSNWISCATCHNPSLGWSDGLATGIGHGMKTLGRATPTIVNTAFNPIQMWDGRKSTLEDQALGPIAADVEMNQALPDLIAKLERIEGYRTMFSKAYPDEKLNEKTVAKAIASFERTVLSTESRFDRWRMGDQSAVDESVKRGFATFTGKANCATCHSGFNFTDNGFHNIGVKDTGDRDLGRWNERKVAAMKGAFKTPTLRDIALTAPYMRNGALKTLEEVVDHYDRGGDVKDNLSGDMKPLNLTAQEKADLVAFMKSLTGKPMQLVVPQLPQ
ncbi:MAG TPA: cytochrome c peroxidase [Burkholderiales bacterium]|jgi:cytochrome c peroxidase|nr:cytochrome c peroxidase [Burkholderiales bacterium]